MAGENFMDTQTGGEGETLQAQPKVEPSGENYIVESTPQNPPVNEPTPASPIQVQTVVDAPVVESQPELIPNQPTQEDVGYMDWFSGETLTNGIKQLDSEQIEIDEEDDNPLSGVSVLEEEDEPDFNPLDGITTSDPIIVNPVLEKKEPTIDVNQITQKHPDLNVNVNENGLMTFPKKEVVKPQMTVVKSKPIAPESKPTIDYKSMEGEILKYKEKPDNDYRIVDGAWQRKSKGSDYWHTITNEGSLNALNKRFNVSVPKKEVFTYPTKPNNEYIVQEGQWFERVKDTYKWTPITNAGRINELNRHTKQSVPIQKKPNVFEQIQQYNSNGLFGVPTIDFGTKELTRSDVNQSLNKAIDVSKSAGIDFSTQKVQPTRLSGGQPFLQEATGSGLFSTPIVGNSLIDTRSLEFENETLKGLEKARQEELSQVSSEVGRQQINERYDRLISAQQAKVIETESYLKKNNEQYWKNVAEKKPDVQKPLTSDNFNKNIHNDNLTLVNNELKMVLDAFRGSELDMSNANVESTFNQINEFISQDLDTWRGVYGQHLTDEQLNEFKEYQKYLKLRVNEDIEDVSYVDMLVMKQGLEDLTDRYEKTKEINNEINKAHLSGKSVSEYQLDKKKVILSELANSGGNDFIDRTKELANATIEIHDFLLPYIKSGKVVQGENGMYSVSKNISKEEQTYLGARINEMLGAYEESKQSNYNTLQDDISATTKQRNYFNLLKDNLINQLEGLDEGTDSYKDVLRKIDIAKSKVNEFDSRLSDLKNGNRAFFLTEPKKVAQGVAEFANESSARNIFKSLDKSLTPKQQFDAFYENLWNENKKLAQLHNIDTGKANVFVDKLKSWLDWETLGVSLTPEEKKYYANKKMLNSMLGLYMNNENGLTERSASFFDSFMNSLQQGLFGDVSASGGWMNQTEIAQNIINGLAEKGFDESDLANPINIKDLKERTNVSWSSGEFAGQALGTTGAIMVDLMIAEAVNPVSILKSPKIWSKLEKLSSVNDTVKIAKHYQDILSKSRYGKYITEAVEQGYRFEKAGLIFGSSEEELNWKSGMAGSFGGGLMMSALTKLPTKQIAPIVSYMFGNRTDQAVSTITKLGNATRQGFGETAEEFSQELVSIYNNTLNDRGFWDELSSRFGDIDSVTKFVISSMVMGGGMGFVQPTKTMEIYNSMDEETKAQVDDIVYAVQEDFKQVEIETEAIIDKATQIQETKAKIEESEVVDKTDEAITEAPLIESETDESVTIDDDIQMIENLVNTEMVEQAISETESNPALPLSEEQAPTALRDVESTAKELEGLNKTAAINGNKVRLIDIVNELSTRRSGDEYFVITKNDPTGKGQKTTKEVYDYVNERIDVNRQIGKIQQAVESVRDAILKTDVDKVKSIIDKSNFNKDALSVIQQFHYKNPEISISEAYHKAKADGSNTELVKAVESLLSKEQTPTEDIETKKADIERRRQEALKKFGTSEKQTSKNNIKVLGTDEYVSRELMELAYSNDNGNNPEIGGGGQSLDRIIERGGYSKEELLQLLKPEIDKINAKYDAELKAVESLLSKEQTPTASDVESTAKKPNNLTPIPKTANITSKDYWNKAAKRGLDDGNVVQDKINDLWTKKYNELKDTKKTDEFLKTDEVYQSLLKEREAHNKWRDDHYHAIEIRDALKKGFYEKAIANKGISAEEAKSIIESAGLEVPKEIESLLSEEQSYQIADIDKKVEPIIEEKQLTPQETEKNSLLDLKTKYNQMTPAKRRTKAGKELLSQINIQASKQGFAIDATVGKGKINILNDKNRTVGKTNIKETLPTPTDEQINFAVRMVNGNSLSWDGNPLTSRIDLPISRADIRKGEKDILSGNFNSLPAKRVIYALNEFKDETMIPYVMGSGNQVVRTAYPIEGNIREDDTNVYISPEDQAIIDSEREMLAKEYDEWFNSLDEDAQIEILDDYEGRNEKTAITNEPRGKSKTNVSDEAKKAEPKGEEITFLPPVQKGQPARKMQKVDGVWMLNGNGEMKTVDESIQKQADVQYRSEEEAKLERKLKPKGLDSKTLDNIYNQLEKLKMGKGNTYASIIPPAVFNAIIDLAKAFVKAGDSVNTAIRKASNQILSKSVEDGTITEKQASVAQEDLIKQVSGNNDKNKDGSNKKTGITKLINELKGNSATKVKDTKNIRQLIKEYAEETLSLGELNSVEVKGIMGRLVNAKTPSELREAINRIDAIGNKQQENVRKSLLSSIKSKLSDKNLTVKSGKNKKGKLTTSQFVALKDYTESLGDISGKTLDELLEIDAVIDGIIKEGRTDQKAIDEAKSLRRKKDRGTMFEPLAKYNKRKPTELKSIREIQEFFNSVGSKVVIIDGHEVTSESQALLLIEKNPSLNVANSVGYDKSSIKNVAFGERKLRKALMRLNPLQAAKNTTSLFQKIYYGAGEELKALIDEKFTNAIPKAVHDRREGQMNKIRDISRRINSVFGGKSKADKILTKKADIQPNKAITSNDGYVTNDHIVDYYNIAQMEGYAERLSKSGVDVQAVNDYVNKNAELKAYADLLMDYYNSELKGEYEATYIAITNKPFNEGLYYPTSSIKQFENVLDTDSLFSGDSAGRNNLINAVSGHLKDKTGFKGEINTNETAREKLFKYIESMEHSKAYIPIAEDFNNLVRPEIQSELRKKLGENTYQELLDTMQILLTKNNPYNKKSLGTSVMNATLSWGVLGTLGWKLGSIPKQAIAFTNLIGAGLEDGVTPLDYFKGFAPTNKAEREALSKLLNSNWLKERFLEGGIDMETRRIYNQMKDSALKKGFGNLTDILMTPVKAGDATSVMLGSFPLALAYYRKGIAKGMSVDEAYEFAYFNVSDKSERALQSSRDDVTSLEQKTPIGRLLYTFKSAQTAMMTKVVDAGRKLTSGQKLTTNEKRQAWRDLTYYPIANAMFVALSSKAVMALLTGEDMSDEDREKAINELAVGTLSSDMQGFGIYGTLTDFAVNKWVGDEWKNNFPMARFTEDITTAVASTPMLFKEGGIEQLTDSEIKSMRRLFLVENLYSQITDWVDYSEGKQEFNEALMNWNDYDEKGESLFDRFMEEGKSDGISTKTIRGGGRRGSRSSSRSSGR
jgi:hypothetical protein